MSHEKDLELALHVHSDVPGWLCGDATRLKQVLINLVSNAVKLTEKGEVLVDVECEETHEARVTLHFSVRDTGIGIPIEKLEQIFSAFEQADKSTTREFGGTGLGLAIASSIAKAMGGRVWVESLPGFMLTEQLRSTTLLHDTVVIMLTCGGQSGDVQRCEELGVSACLMKPVKQSELLAAIVVAVRGQSPRVHSQPEATDEPVSLPPLKILLAEDAKANQIMAVGLLTKWGHTVEVAENVERAIALWQSGSFDVILMDLQRPVLDGLEATGRIRELESGQRIPIMAVTARAMKGDRERCVAAGMDDYVSKPVRKAELYRALKSLMDGASAHP